MLQMCRIIGEVLRLYGECVRLFMASDCESEMIVACECEM